MLNAHWARRKAILSFTEFIRGRAGLGRLLGKGCLIHCIGRFPIIAQCSKCAHYFNRVVGPVVLPTLALSFSMNNYKCKKNLLFYNNV